MGYGLLLKPTETAIGGVLPVGYVVSKILVEIQVRSGIGCHHRSCFHGAADRRTSVQVASVPGRERSSVQYPLQRITVVGGMVPVTANECTVEVFGSNSVRIARSSETEP